MIQKEALVEKRAATAHAIEEFGGEAPVQAKKRYRTKGTAWDFPGSITNCERFWGAYAPHALCNKA